MWMRLILWSVLDAGSESAEYDALDDLPRFSPDSRRLAYDARRAGKWVLVVDGAESKEYDAFARGAVPVFDAPGAVHILAVDGKTQGVILVELGMEAK